MKIRFTFDAESKEEIEFINQLVQVRDMGLESELSNEEVARMFVMVAQGLLSESYREQDVRPSNTEIFVCPSCGSDLESIETMGIGEDVQCIPCGCMVDMDELPSTFLQEYFSN